jgi:hypothetical protein
MTLLFGTAALSLAGNHPANPSKSISTFATTAGKVKANPWHDAIVSQTGSVVVQRVGNGTCPVMNHRITSKHNATITLSNGKHMEVCCAPCKEKVEKDLSKYEAYLF